MDDSLMRSLGIFAISVVLILLLILIYFIMKSLKCCGKIKELLRKKMFYSGPIRYMIVSYLKQLNQFASLFLLGLTNNTSSYIMAAYGLVIIILALWPIWSS